MPSTPSETSTATPYAPSDFASRWAAYVARLGMATKFPIVRFVVTDPRVSEETSRFLSETGLPDAAGFQFNPKVAGKCLTNVFGGPQGERPGEWENPPARLRPYLILGFTQGGDPLCLDTDHQKRREQVIILNHENAFEEAEVVNSGVVQLAECILIFQEMIEEYQREYGDEAELYEGNMPLPLVERALARIGRMDKRAAEEGSYWPAQMQDI